MAEMVRIHRDGNDLVAGPALRATTNPGACILTREFVYHTGISVPPTVKPAHGKKRA